MSNLTNRRILITVRAAAEIGWVRMPPEQRTQLAEQLKAVHGDTQWKSPN